MRHPLTTAQAGVAPILILLTAAAVRGGESPVVIGGRSQLFVDQLLVREADSVSFRLQRGMKHPRNPLIRADQPWEGWRLEIYGSVLYDAEDGLFKMWYLAAPSEYFDRYVTCYATSRDGIAWDKPLVGTVRSKNGKRHNVVAECLLASVIKDKNDPDPQRRYKMICFSEAPRRGYHTMVSPNGLTWEPLSAEPIAPKSDVITGYWDRRRQLYVALPKLGHVVRGISRRCFWSITSPDFDTWSKPQPAFVPDLRDDAGSLARIEQVRPLLDVPDNPELMRTEFYGVGVYQAESCTLGFPWIFTVNNNARYGNQEGPGELQLAVTRDLVNWERPWRVPCVPRGELDEWDCGFFTTAAEAIRVGDEIRLYYGGANYTHGTPCLYRAEGTGRRTRYTGSIGLVRWKLDRFVSVDGPAGGGTLTTVPVVFDGSKLEINAATRSGGSLVVELLDAAGRAIERVGPSDPVQGDSLRHVVSFDGRQDVSALAGQPVSLRFQIKDAELFSFAFRD